MVKLKISTIALFCSIIIICYAAMVRPLQITSKTVHYGFFNYKMERYCFKNDTVAIEPFVFSYSFISPNMYTYGISGYTKTNILPFGRVLKVANVNYDSLRPLGIYGPLNTSLSRLNEYYGDRLVLYDSILDFSEVDQNIFLKLKVNGSCDFEDYFYIDKCFPYTREEIENIKYIRDGLMNIL